MRRHDRGLAVDQRRLREEGDVPAPAPLDRRQRADAAVFLRGDRDEHDLPREVRPGSRKDIEDLEGCDETGLHVAGSSSVEAVTVHDTRERIPGPLGEVARRDDVDVPGQEHRRSRSGAAEPSGHDRDAGAGDLVPGIARERGQRRGVVVPHVHLGADPLQVVGDPQHHVLLEAIEGRVADQIDEPLPDACGLHCRRAVQSSVAFAHAQLVGSVNWMSSTAPPSENSKSSIRATLSKRWSSSG